MDLKKIKKIQKKIDRLRASPNNIRSNDLIRVANSLGRKLFKRGKEPTYISDLLKKSRPISIPNHPGTLKIGTAVNILDSLEQDVFEIKLLLDE